MSIRSDCSEALRMLLDDPRLRMITQGPKGIFTELDVILLAARRNQFEAADEREHWIGLAQREASETLGWFYRDGQVVRFGPLRPGEHEELDYARAGSRIIYAAPNVKSLKTPNGTFPQLLHKDDPIRRAGRRLVNGRDDLEHWGAPENANTPERREIARLKAEVAALQARAKELEQDNQRLRERAATAEKDKAA